MPQLETMQKQMQTITDNKAVVEQNLGAMPVSYTHLDVYKRQVVWLWAGSKCGLQIAV